MAWWWWWYLRFAIGILFYILFSTLREMSDTEIDLKGDTHTKKNISFLSSEIVNMVNVLEAMSRNVQSARMNLQANDVRTMTDLRKKKNLSLLFSKPGKITLQNTERMIFPN